MSEKVARNYPANLVEENPFLDLLILAELESEEQKVEILGKIASFLEEMHINKKVLTDYGDYVIHVKHLTPSSRGETIKLELRIDEFEYGRDISNIPFEEYVGQIYISVREVMKLGTEDSEFKINENGLLEAFQYFNRAVDFHSSN